MGAGDELRVTAYGLDDLSDSYRVGDAGTISLPLLGAVDAEGLTVAELETALTEAVRDRALVRNPSVSVQISEYRPFYVIGEVRNPGEYAYVPNASVLTAMSVAGGPTFRAADDRVVITRRVDGRTVEGTASLDAPIMPGDTIRVPEGWF